MRNLKKFLALVMAMVMAFSLMLTANAASKYDQVKEWTDKDQVTEEFIEAVDVLSGMKIFQGDARGFAPGDTITRAETAALIYRLATGDVDNVRNGLYANYGNFTDVSESDWFAGYVGYCANAGYIKGRTATTFDPYASVTGYEALAMILRAVGYDKNGEFTGTTWQTNVSALGTRLGVLDDVKTSDYANTLHLPSRRDVVASILFACAQLDTVTYTPSLGYETGYIGNGGTADGLDGKSLGKVYFGLTEIKDGIIVGNQDTGETYTRVNKAKSGFASYYGYFHQERNWDPTAKSGVGDMVATTDTWTIDAKTGIDMFGHKVHVWYDERSSSGYKTYALYDQAEKTALVTATDGWLSLRNGQTPGLGVAAQNAGFSVDLKNSMAVVNDSFGISGSVATYDPDNTQAQESDYVLGTGHGIAGGDYTTGFNSNTALGANGTSYPLFLLISNNKANTVDMVIALNVEVSRVTQVNNYATYPTVTVPEATNNTAFNKNTKDLLAQGALTATSTKTLGDGVVAVSIRGTKTGSTKIGIGEANYVPPVSYTQPAASPLANATATNGNIAGGNENDLFRLSKPSSVVEGTVTQYKYDATSHTGHITIDGQRIERSLLADTIVTKANAGVNLTATANTYQKYRAYLDAEGKYVWVEPITERTFVYGTYVDYQTPYGSSSYEYTMIGVNEKGEQTKQVITSLDGAPIDSNNYQTIGNGLHIPYRDSGNVAGLTPGAYVAFSTNENGALQTNDVTSSLGWHQGGSSALNTNAFGSQTANTEINATDAKLGMKNTAKGTGAGANDEWYITENTKIIAVSGAGTDTQKVKVYNGITELLDGGTKVIIQNKENVVKKGALDADSTNWYMAQMWYTESNFTYASTIQRAKQIDTLILPADALKWEGKSNLYYVGDNAKTSEIQVGSNWYTQFTMYVNGDEQNVWVEGKDSTANTSAYVIADGANNGNKNDTFYELVTTDRTLPDGTPVYMIHDADFGAAVRTSGGTAVSVTTYDANGRPDVNGGEKPVIWEGTYWAATYDSQTATVNPSNTTAGLSQAVGAGGNSQSATNAKAANYRVADAKVVNLNKDNKTTTTSCIWPGITDLGTLNDAASTAAVYNTNLPKVSCLVDPANPLQITVIYVQWDQT